MYVKKTSEVTSLIISLYVDDLFVIGSINYLVKEFKLQMENMFEMSALGKTMFEKMRDKISVRNMKVKEECCEMTIHATCRIGKPFKIGKLPQMNIKWRALTNEQ